MHNLLVGEGDARARLRENEGLIMFVLHLDVPKQFEPEQKRILKLVTKKEAFQIDDKIVVTAFKNTIFSIRNSTASKVIQQLNGFFHSVRYSGSD